MPDFTQPMPLPPLPKLNIPDEPSDKEEVKAPPIDLTPVDTIPKKDDKPTEEQVNSFKPLMVVAVLAVGLMTVSWFQGSKTVSTEIRLDNAQTPQTQSASVTWAEEVKPTPKPLPMPERDPQKLQLNLMLLEHLNNAKKTQDQLVEARASWYRSQAQQLAQRNPQSYPMYLAGQLEKVNLALANQVRANQTTLVGTEEQTRVASQLLIDSQAIALEQIRWKVANGEMTDIPEELRSRLTPNATSPYIQIADLARNSDTISYLNKLNLLADREQELKRVAELEQQNLQAAQNGVKPQVKNTLPTPQKEAKK